MASLVVESGAGDESRTRDLNLGKVALYQLSYSRFIESGANYSYVCTASQYFFTTFLLLEARLGIEPGYTALQAAA